MSELIGLKLTVLPDTSEQAARVTDRIANLMTGLAMDGIASELTVTPYTSEDPA